MMADIQKLMNKMEDLNKEITTIISETKQEIVDDETEITNEEVLAAQAKSGGSWNNCPHLNRQVELCCTTVVKHFNVINRNDQLLGPVKLIFDPGCLHTFVESITFDICNGNCGQICLYLVKIAGCIPFAFSATDALQGVKSNDGTCPTNAKVDLCCQGCICVDNNICCYNDPDKAEEARKKIADALASNPCRVITGADTASAKLLTCKEKGYWKDDGCKDETYVKFTATLKVPTEALSCVASDPAQCGDTTPGFGACK